MPHPAVTRTGVSIITSASWITLLRLLIALIGAFMLSAGKPPDHVKFTTVLFIISVSMDKLDGIVARKYNCCTTFGKHFDMAADKITLTVFFLCLLDLKVINRHLVAAALIRDLLTHAFRNYAASKGIFITTYSGSKARYFIECMAITAGLSSFVFLEVNLANPLRQVSIVCFVVGLVLGYLTFWTLIMHHWREVIRGTNI
jgi:phosphatidylglycerophosphate synthase